MTIWSSIADVHCPVVSRRVRRPDYPCLRDDGLRRVMHERDAARRTWAVSRSVSDRNAYRRLRNEAKRVLDRRRRAYLGELLGRDVRRFWARLKQFGGELLVTWRQSTPSIRGA